MHKNRETVESASPDETFLVGERLARELGGGELVLLTGPLGAGKSVFVRGMAAALGVKKWRGSPTFNLVHEYATAPKLFHADLYRLNNEDVEELGMEDYVTEHSILAVEWSDRATAYLETLEHTAIIRVDVEYQGSHARTVSLVRDGSREAFQSS